MPPTDSLTTINTERAVKKAIQRNQKWESLIIFNKFNIQRKSEKI